MGLDRLGSSGIMSDDTLLTLLTLSGFGFLAMQPNEPFWAYPNLNKILWREMRYDSACLLAIN